jgi:hypothetical protein
MLLVIAQLLVNLYATSVVGAVGYDAARVVAGSEAADRPDARQRAEDSARRQLGGYGRRARFDWSASDDDTVVLHIRAENPALIVRRWAGSLGLDSVDRTLRVRVERLR